MESCNDSNFEKNKKESFYKQQQSLQNITLNKGLSADELIKNILQKVDTDAKVSKFYQTNQKNNIDSNQIFNNVAYPPLNIPQCFFLNSEIPLIYTSIWQLVRVNDNTDFCDRSKLYKILLSSNLPSCTLAQLWSFVNRTKPGELTRNELFILLALVGLIQVKNSDPFNELYRVSDIPVPNFIIQNETLIQSFENENEKLKKSPIDSTNQNEFSDFVSAEINSKNLNEKLNLFDNIDSESNAVTNEINNLTDVGTSENGGELISLFNKKIESIQLETDKYCHLRKLDVQIEEFGDFYSHSNNKENFFEVLPEQPFEKNTKLISNFDGTISNRKKVLNSIKNVIEETYKVLISNNTDSTILEALSSIKGIDFAHDLYSVFKIAKRIELNLFDLTNLCEINSCHNILDVINKKYYLISQVFKKASIEFEDENGQSVEENYDSSLICTICSGFCSSASSILFASSNYHISCANFWLNSIDTILPPNSN